MGKDYRTVAAYGEAEIEIQKSRFIAYVDRAEDEMAAVAFIEKIRKQHWNATHNCAAYIAGEHDQYQKADDDGEPSGTAGKPMLEVLKKMGLKDTVVVVTRYFGGIKLGAGGLIRAYGKCAAAGVRAAALIERRLHTQVAVELEYTLLGGVENQLHNQGYTISDRQFTDKIVLVVLAKAGEEETLEAKLIDWTNGRAVLARLDTVYVDVPVEEASLEKEQA